MSFGSVGQLVVRIQPAAMSMGRSGLPAQPGWSVGMPGLLSALEPRAICGVATVAAAYIATATVALSPGPSENGPEPMKKRTSEKDCARNHERRALISL